MDDLALVGSDRVAAVNEDPILGAIADSDHFLALGDGPRWVLKYDSLALRRNVVLIDIDLGLLRG